MFHSIYGKGLGAVASALSLAGIVALAASAPLPASAAEYDLRIRGTTGDTQRANFIIE